MRLTAALVAATGLLLVVATADGVVAPVWPSFQHDVRHTGRSPFKGPTTNHVLWTRLLSGGPGSPTIGADGTIYITSGMLGRQTRGYLYGFAPNGTKKWVRALPGPPSSTAPGVGADGTIYVHMNGGEGNVAAVERLFAVNPNGTVKWKFAFNGGSASFSSSVQSSPAVRGNTIWVGSMDTGLYALRTNGTVRCAVSPSASSISSSPAVAPDGTVYIVDSSTTLFAYDQYCHFKWSYQLSATPTGTGNDQSPLVAGDGTVYVGSAADAKLYAIRPNGTLRCTFQTGSDIDSTPAQAGNGTIYVASDGLYALTPGCVQKWKFPSGTVLFSSASPVVDAAGRVYWHEGFTAYAVSPAGTQVWSRPANPSAGLEPSVAIGSSGALYLADGGSLGTPSRLHALKTP